MAEVPTPGDLINRGYMNGPRGHEEATEVADGENVPKEPEAVTAAVEAVVQDNEELRRELEDLRETLAEMTAAMGPALEALRESNDNLTEARNDLASVRRELAEVREELDAVKAGENTPAASNNEPEPEPIKPSPVADNDNDGFIDRPSSRVRALRDVLPAKKVVQGEGGHLTGERKEFITEDQLDMVEAQSNFIRRGFAGRKAEIEALLADEDAIATRAEGMGKKPSELKRQLNRTLEKLNHTIEESKDPDPQEEFNLARLEGLRQQRAELQAAAGGEETEEIKKLNELIKNLESAIEVSRDGKIAASESQRNIELGREKFSLGPAKAAAIVDSIRGMYFNADKFNSENPRHLKRLRRKLTTGSYSRIGRALSAMNKYTFGVVGAGVGSLANVFRKKENHHNFIEEWKQTRAVLDEVPTGDEAFREFITKAQVENAAADTIAKKEKKALNEGVGGDNTYETFARQFGINQETGKLNLPGVYRNALGNKELGRVIDVSENKERREVFYGMLTKAAEKRIEIGLSRKFRDGDEAEWSELTKQLTEEKENLWAAVEEKLRAENPYITEDDINKHKKDFENLCKLQSQKKVDALHAKKYGKKSGDGRRGSKLQNWTNVGTSAGIAFAVGGGVRRGVQAATGVAGLGVGAVAGGVTGIIAARKISEEHKRNKVIGVIDPDGSLTLKEASDAGIESDQQDNRRVMTQCMGRLATSMVMGGAGAAVVTGVAPHVPEFVGTTGFFGGKVSDVDSSASIANKESLPGPLGDAEPRGGPLLDRMENFNSGDNEPLNVDRNTMDDDSLRPGEAVVEANTELGSEIDPYTTVDYLFDNHDVAQESQYAFGPPSAALDADGNLIGTEAEQIDAVQYDIIDRYGVDTALLSAHALHYMDVLPDELGISGMTYEQIESYLSSNPDAWEQVSEALIEIKEEAVLEGDAQIISLDGKYFDSTYFADLDGDGVPKLYHSDNIATGGFAVVYVIDGESYIERLDCGYQVIKMEKMTETGISEMPKEYLVQNPPEPIKPTTPGDEPTLPTEPTEPTAPTEPTETTEPTEPTEPTETTEPTEPTEPTETTEPTEPTEPTETTEPTEPTTPTPEPKDPSASSIHGHDGFDGNADDRFEVKPGTETVESADDLIEGGGHDQGGGISSDEAARQAEADKKANQLQQEEAERQAIEAQRRAAEQAAEQARIDALRDQQERAAEEARRLAEEQRQEAALREAEELAQQNQAPNVVADEDGVISDGVVEE